MQIIIEIIVIRLRKIDIKYDFTCLFGWDFDVLVVLMSIATVQICVAIQIVTDDK